jgi:UMF1 family MFS transporter
VTTDEPDRLPVLERLGLHRPELRAWVLYDWANSAMVVVIITAVFPIYFSSVAARDLAPAVATARFATATTLALIAIAVLAPVLGTIADVMPLKKPLLGTFLAIGVTAVAAMATIGPGEWLFAAVLFAVANVGANGSFVFYDSLLPHIARDDELDRVSSAGYAIGYLGGGLLLALNLAWIQRPDWFGLPHGPDLSARDATLPARLAFVSVAAWWAVFALPLFRRVKEPRVATSGERGFDAVRSAFRRLARTAQAIREYPDAARMLLAFLVYNDGIGTIIRMAAIYGTEIGIGRGALIAAILLVQFIGIPCAFAFGGLARRIGAKRAILLGLAVYAGIAVFGYFVRTTAQFFALAVAVGAVQGGTQALSRSLFASLVPRDRTGEFFGFFAVTEKFAGILGPAIFAATVAVTGSSRSAILGVIAFFVVGAALLRKVDARGGAERAARSTV